MGGAIAEAGERAVNVEFVLGEPHGPLHVGHGRGAALARTVLRRYSSDGTRGDARVLR